MKIKDTHCDNYKTNQFKIGKDHSKALTLLKKSSTTALPSFMVFDFRCFSHAYYVFVLH